MNPASRSSKPTKPSLYTAAKSSSNQVIDHVSTEETTLGASSTRQAPVPSVRPPARTPPMSPSLLEQYRTLFAKKGSTLDSRSPKTPPVRVAPKTPPPITWAPSRKLRRKSVGVDLTGDQDSGAPNDRAAPLHPAGEASPLLDRGSPASCSDELSVSPRESPAAIESPEIPPPVEEAEGAGPELPREEEEEYEVFIAGPSLPSEQVEKTDDMNISMLLSERPCAATAGPAEELEVGEEEEEDSAPAPVAKRRATEARVNDPSGQKMIPGMVPREPMQSRPSAAADKPTKSQLRRMAAKTQHTSTPADDIRDLRDRLSDDEEVGPDENFGTVTPAAVKPRSAMTAEEREAERKRKDRERKSRKRKADAIVRQAATAAQVASELTARLDRGKTTWRTPLRDPEHPKYNRALVMCEFTPENGFLMNQNRIDLVFQFRKPQYEQSEKMFNQWCPLAQVYVDEMMSNPVTMVERDRIVDGNAHPETATRTRNAFLGPWFLLLRLSCCDPLLAKPVTSLRELVRPMRLYGLLCFLREYYSQPGRNASTFKNKLFALQCLLKWLNEKPELRLSRQQIQSGVIGGIAGEAWAPPPEGTNDAILQSFACATDAEATQASFWITSALEEIKKLVAFASDYARADPVARPNETGLRKVGDWPSRELFKKTLAELRRRLEVFKTTYFAWDEENKVWSRTEAFKALSLDDQRKVFFEYQEYLIAVTIVALHGSRRQVAMRMSTKNMTFARAEGQARPMDVDQGEADSEDADEPTTASGANVVTLAINFAEKVESRRHATLPLNDRYFEFFHVYHQAILPRIAVPVGSDVYWRQESTGLALSPSAFSRIHQKVWHDVGLAVQDGDTTDVPTGFSPLQVRRWIVTMFFDNDGLNEAQLADYASIMNTSVEMMRKYYNRQKSEIRQVQITRKIADMFDEEEQEEKEEEDIADE